MSVRIATTPDGRVCLRCNGFLLGTGVVACACSNEQLKQFDSETLADQKLVKKMLFTHRMCNDPHLPMPQRQKDTRDLQKLYKENEQLAIRNGVQSPFRTG